MKDLLNNEIFQMFCKEFLKFVLEEVHKKSKKRKK